MQVNATHATELAQMIEAHENANVTQLQRTTQTQNLNDKLLK
jgi:hypothetical protein